jgi:hypothetical protein
MVDKQKTLGQISFEARINVVALKTDSESAYWKWETLTNAQQEAEEVAARAVAEECAKLADMWGNGKWKPQFNGRLRFTQRDMRTQVNLTGRGVAEDIRSRAKNEKPASISNNFVES